MDGFRSLKKVGELNAMVFQSVHKNGSVWTGKRNLILATPYRISTIIQTMLMPMYLPHPKEILKDLFKDSTSKVYKV